MQPKIRIPVFPIFLTLVMHIISGTSTSKATEIYVLSGPTPDLSTNPTAFGKIDTTTGAYTQISSLSPGLGSVGNLAYNPNSNDFFVTVGQSSSTTLNRLSLSGTLSGPNGVIGHSIYGMVYRSSNNSFFAYDWSTDTTGTFGTGGGWSTAGGSGVSALAPRGGRLTFHNNTVYGAMNNGGNGLIGTFPSSAFVPMGGGPFFANMVLASDGTTLYGLYSDGAAQKTLYTLNPNTGALTPGPAISGSGLGSYFHGAAVPEPSTYILGALATLFLVCANLIRRKRSRDSSRKGFGTVPEVMKA